MNEKQHDTFVRRSAALISALRDGMTTRYGQTTRHRIEGSTTNLVAADGTTVTMTDTYLATMVNTADLNWALQADAILNENAAALRNDKRLDLTSHDA